LGFLIIIYHLGTSRRSSRLTRRNTVVIRQFHILSQPLSPRPMPGSLKSTILLEVPQRDLTHCWLQFHTHTSARSHHSF
jgi:hypothetical protein